MRVSEIPPQIEVQFLGDDAAPTYGSTSAGWLLVGAMGLLTWGAFAWAKRFRGASRNTRTNMALLLGGATLGRIGAMAYRAYSRSGHTDTTTIPPVAKPI
jgi:hypothetical protein